MRDGKITSVLVSCGAEDINDPGSWERNSYDGLWLRADGSVGLTRTGCIGFDSPAQAAAWARKKNQKSQEKYGRDATEDGRWLFEFWRYSTAYGRSIYSGRALLDADELRAFR